tara:strand:+ start:139327 stop:140385 length:1059 start_codon:yes stop_codon:yes gene_type:complete
MPEDNQPYDSFLLVSFGGPEGPDDVIPFLENVLRGKRVPRERMLEVAEHYKQFGGISPINQHNRELLAAIGDEFKAANIDLPVYWGNRNWHPLLTETLGEMRDAGHKRTLAFFTSMFSCYSGCRQYRENLIAAREAVGTGAPQVDKLRMGFNHPGFVETLAENVQSAVDQLRDKDSELSRDDVTIFFTAHSIPTAMSDNCDYVMQLNESSRLVADAVGIRDWQLVYQSRSGPPQQPWLEPDVCDSIVSRDEEKKIKALVIMPIGFVSDHMEVMFDLDEEAAAICKARNIPMARAATAGTGPKFVRMVRELVEERIGRIDQRRAVGNLGPWHDICPADCCTYTPSRPQRPAQT